MNVRTGITIACLLCAVALGSICLAQPPPDEEWNTWRNDKLHYTLKWPDSWSQDRSNLGRYGLQRLLKNEAPGVQIQVLNMPTGVLAAEQLAQVAAAMAKSNPAMQEKVSEESGELGGATGIAAVYNGQQDGEAVRTLAHFISTADGLFVLVGITPQQTADQHWEEIGRIVGSFRYGLDQTEPEDGTKQPQTPTEPVTYSLQVPEGWRVAAQVPGTHAKGVGGASSSACRGPTTPHFSSGLAAPASHNSRYSNWSNWPSYLQSATRSCSNRSRPARLSRTAGLPWR